ncbi:unnamed protein product [Orchesella dallaii]|uniref:O-acyltransferase WSD1 C-terminal domain-containing protein n=1 Tax=Orchesella dallaii TaxID=48710 RepID=A0ABP1PZ20_9HEXA
MFAPKALGTTSHLQNEKAFAHPSSLPLLQDEKTSEKSLGGESTESIVVPGYYAPVKPPREIGVNSFSTIIKFILINFVSGIFWLLSPVFAVIYFILGLLPRLFVSLILSWNHDVVGFCKLMPILRGFGSTSGRYHTVMLTIRGRCDIIRLRRHMFKVLNVLDPNTGEAKFPYMKNRVVRRFGYLCLKECCHRFNIENHIRYFGDQNQNEFLRLDDIISFLEENYEDPFQNIPAAPQWELLVIPRFVYSNEQAKLLAPLDGRQFYSLVFRFHHGIMDWTMFQQFLTEFLGRTSGRVRSPFSTPVKSSCWTGLKTSLAVVFIAPFKFFGQIFKKWKKFGDLKVGIQRTSLGLTKTYNADSFEDVKLRTFTSIDTVLATCVRVAARNLILGQNLKWPKRLGVTRVFNSSTSQLAGVDFVSINYSQYRNAIERLHATFHTMEREYGACVLGAQRRFNKIMMFVAGTLPYVWNAWIYRTIMKADVIIEVWPSADEPAILFGTDLVADIVGWSGNSGVDASNKPQ